MSYVIDKDLGWKRIVRKMNFVNGKEIRAGVLPSAGTEANGIPIAQVAKWNEYGTPATAKRPWSVPARPFMSIACDENKGWKKESNEAIGNILGGAEVISELNMVGMQMQEDIQSVFGDRSKLRPNAPSTIAKKGFDAPLIETGKLEESIDFEVK